MTKLMMFYDQPAALSRETHRKLHLDGRSGFSFAAHTHWLPVSGVEFGKAARHYPIVFVREGEAYSPVVLVGLEPGKNDFVDEKGQWRKGCYVPAFVRRYPFVPAQAAPTQASAQEAPASESAPDPAPDPAPDNAAGSTVGSAVGKQARSNDTALADTPLPNTPLPNTPLPNTPLTVCIDTAFAGWNESEGEALFTQDGTNTPYLDNMVKLIDGFAAEMNRTAAFTRDLDKLNLFVHRSLTVRRPDGTSFTLNDIHIVDEQKLAKLYGQELLKLNMNGALAWIFAHLASLDNLRDMVEKVSVSPDKAAEMRG